MSEVPSPKIEAKPDPTAGALKAIFLIAMVDLMGFGIIIPLLPFYVPNQQEHPLQVTLIFSVFSICQFIGAPILGALSDKYGRRLVLVLSQVGSAAGYIILGLATLWTNSNPALMLALVYTSRLIDGFTGGNISTAQAYVSDVTTQENRAKGMGMLGAAFGIGFTLGPIMGGLLSHFFGPAVPAYAAAALCLVAAVLSQVYLVEPPKHGETESVAWLHPSRFTPILRKPVLLQLLVISFFTMAAFVMMESTIALYLNWRFGFQSLGVTLFFCFVGVVIVFVQGGLVGRLTRRYGEWPLAVAGTLLVAIGMVGFTGTAWWPMLVLLGIAGATNAAGRSLQQPTVSSLISKFSDRRDQGVAFGLYHGLGSLARVVGPIIAGLAYKAHHTGAFMVACGIALAMSLWTFFLRQPAPQIAAPAETMAHAAMEGA